MIKLSLRSIQVLKISWKHTKLSLLKSLCPQSWSVKKLWTVRLLKIKKLWKSLNVWSVWKFSTSQLSVVLVRLQHFVSLVARLSLASAHSVMRLLNSRIFIGRPWVSSTRSWSHVEFRDVPRRMKSWLTRHWLVFILKNALRKNANVPMDVVRFLTLELQIAT